MQLALVEYYSDAHPSANVRMPTMSSQQESNSLVTRAKYHSYIIKDGRRITPCKSAEKAPNSIIQMELGGHIFVGQVLAIIQHHQFRIERPTILLYVRWFRRSDEVDTTEWDP